MVKIFLLGATGYIGGDALYTIANAHPEYEITALVRNSEKGAQVASQYASVKLVYGDVDSADLIDEETKKADIVMHFANSADDVPGTTAICKALGSHPSTSPVYYIHTSGTGVLTFADMERKTFGDAATKVYDDWDNLSEIHNLPEYAPHRNVDDIVWKAGSENPEEVKTAIVSPPMIYGPGRGPGKQKSVQVPTLANLTLQQGHGVQVGAGKTFWCGVHVQDLTKVYLKLVEAAAAGGGKATWGKEGYYQCESTEFAWGDVSKMIADAAAKKGYIKDASIVSISGEEADKLVPYASYMWGANSRSRAIRARKLFGWEPTHPALKDEIEPTLEVEAKELGIEPGHAKVAAGDA